MNITKESTGSLTAEINIHLDAADYKGNVNNALKEQAKKANIPGFRPGKVPIGMIRKMAGLGLVIEEISKTVNQELGNYIKDEKLSLLGDPLPTVQKQEEDFDINCEKDIDFTFEVGLAPDFEVNFDLKKAPPLHKVSIDKAFLNKEIENYLDRFGEIINPEEAGEGDIIYGNLFETDDKGEAIEAGFSQMVAFNPERIEDKDFFKPMFGTKLEEIIEVDPFGIDSDLDALAKILFIEKEQLEELKEKTLRFQLKKLNRVTKAELGEKLFQDVSGALKWENAEEITTEEVFKAKLTEHLENDLAESAKWYFRNEAQKAIMDVNTLELPDEFLKKWLVQTKKDYDEERVEAEYEEFTHSVTWSLIVEKIMEGQDIKVTEEELKEGLLESVRQNMGAMGQGLDERMEQEYLNYMMQNQEMLDMQYRRQLNEKLYTYLEGHLDPKDKKITATKFVELTEKDKK